MNVRKIVSIIAAGCSLLLYAGCAESSNSYTPQTVEQKIKSQVVEYISRWNYKTGLSVCVYSPTRNLEVSLAYGKASLMNNTENTVDTPHFIYSISKSFVAASIIELSNEGKLFLDDKLSKYIDGLNTIYINTDATIDELLCHRSGIYDYTGNASIFYANPFSNGDEWKPEKILDLIKIPSITSGKFCYSSANYILLGMVIEKITDKKMNEYIRDTFLNTLSLSFQLAPQDNIKYSKIAHPHVYPNTQPVSLPGDSETPIDLISIINNGLELTGDCSWCAGGMTGTAQSIAMWGYHLLSNRGKIDNSIRNKIIKSVAEYTDETLESEAYGYGIRKLFHEGTEFIGSYGRSLGDENLMFYNELTDTCIVILSSSNTKSDGNPNIDNLMYAIYNEVAE